MSGNNIGALFVQLMLDDDDFDLEKPAKDVEKFGGQLDAFADKIEHAFVSAMKAATAAVAGLAAASIVVGAQFQAQMSKVGVIAGATGDGFDKLTDKARELGATTAYSATEAASAMELLASSGMGVNQILTATGSVLTLAGAGGTDLNTAAGVLVSTLAQFSLGAEQSARVADVLAKATADTQFQVDDLAEAMKYGGIAGAGFGWSLEQTVAALAMFRDLGMQGSQAGTALRSSMVGAATSSQKNVDTLKKYGLTLADVSPDTKSFAEILEAVGRTSMTASDAMVVFGTEAGAALNQLARQAADGSTRYQDLVLSLEESTGTAAGMFGDMQANVVGSFNELTSTAEEGLLSMFDAVKVPLDRFIKGITESLGSVVTYFQQNSAALTESLSSMVDGSLGWLKENQEFLSVAFTMGASAVVDLLGVLGKLLPMLDEIAMLVTAAFVAKVVFDFGTALNTAILGVRGLQAAIIALNTEMVISTGGIWAGVAAVGAFVAALALMASAYGQAEEAARKLRLEEERGTKVSQEAADQIAARYGTEIATSKARADAKKIELAAAGELTQARREELAMLGKLSEAEIAAAIARGDLVEYAGEIRSVTSLYEQLEEDALVPVQKRYQEMADDQKKLTDRADQLNSQVIEWQGRGADQAELWGKYSAGFAGGMVEAQAQVLALRGEAAALGKGMEHLQSQSADAGARVLETYAKGAKGAKEMGAAIDVLSEKEQKAAERAEEAWANAFNSATSAAIDFAKAQRQRLEDQGASDREALRLKQERELEDMDDALKKALAQVEDNEVAKLIVGGQFAQAKEDMEKRHALEVKKFAWEQWKDETEKKKKALDDRKAAHESAMNDLIGLERENTTRVERFDAEKADFFAKNASLTLAEKTRAERAFAVQREKILDEQVAAAKAATEEEKAARRSATRQALAQARMILGSIADAVGAVARGVGTAAQMAGKFMGTLFDLAKKAVGAVTEVFSALTGGEVSLDALGYIATALEAIRSGDAGGGSVGEVAAKFVEEMGANAGLFLDSVVSGLPAVVEALLTQVPKIVRKFADALPAIAGQVVRLVPQIVKALAVNIPIVVQGIADALPLIIKALANAIPGLIAVLGEALPILFQAIVVNLPILVEALAAAIPDLVKVLADNLPTLIMAIVSAIPSIVSAFIDSLPLIIQGLVKAIPILIEGLLSEIPRLVSAVMDMIPGVAAMVSDAIVQIVGNVGDIVAAVLEGLPDMIRGVIDAVPQIVDAVFKMIPVLIEEVIAQLPSIIQALLEGVLGIVVHVIEQLPDLISRILELVPQLVLAIVDLIPWIITSVIEAIPKIITGLIEGLPRLIPALLLLIPELVFGIIAALPQIVVALVKGIVVELILKLPQLIAETAKALWEGLKETFAKLGQMIAEFFGFGKDKDKKNKKDKSSSYSGLSYVAATMRGVTLHKGEAVLTAQENQQRMFGGAAGASQSNPSAQGSGNAGDQGGGLEALFAVDGRIIDGVMMRANGNGKGTAVAMMKRKAGVRSGVKSTGRYSFWSR